MTTETELIIREHAPLVRRLALRMVSRLPASIALDDLIQAGMIGLMDAARRYKTQFGAAFESYATTRITGAMLDELRSQDWVPRSTRAAARKVEQAIQEATRKVGYAPSDREVAECLGMSLEEYRDLLMEAQSVQIVHYENALENCSGEDQDTDSELIRQILESAQSEYGDPVEQLMASDFGRALAKAISQLPEKEQLVLALSYEQDLNYKEIGQVMDLTQGRVSQIRTQAIARLRTILKAQDWDSLPSQVALCA